MGNKEDIIALMRQRGPIIPLHVAKLLGTNTLIASAHLSELRSKDAIKISHVKLGGTPLYYLAGQESRLQDYADKLHEKERRAYELLKNEKVLSDTSQSAVVRFALRQIKDFAKPVEVKVGERRTLFWRWYLTPMAEVGELIKNQLKLASSNTAERSSDSKPQPPKQSEVSHPQSEVKSIPHSIPPPIVETQALHPKTVYNSQSTIVQDPKPKNIFNQERPSPVVGSISDGFLGKINNYFEEKGIVVEETEIIKKAKHGYFIIRIPSPVGELFYFCEAKQKKSISEGDISEAIVRSEKLPLLFITGGIPTKKTKEMIEKNKGIKFVTI